MLLLLSPYWEADIDSKNHSVHMYSKSQPLAKLVYVFMMYEGIIKTNKYIK